MLKTTAVLALLITPAFGASFHSPPHSGTGHPMPGRAGPAPGPQITFESGPQAQADINAVANATLDWHSLAGCSPVGVNFGCQTNQTLNITGGPDALSAAVSTPVGLGVVSGGGLSTYQYIDLHFSTPVAGVGMNITDGYRFNWIIGLEAFDVNGTSLGKVEENGFDQIQPPTIFNAAIANSDIISSVRIYTPDTGYGCPGCLLAGSVHIHEAPEPSTLALIGAGLIFIAFWRRRTLCR